MEYLMPTYCRRCRALVPATSREVHPWDADAELVNAPGDGVVLIHTRCAKRNDRAV